MSGSLQQAQPSRREMIRGTLRYLTLGGISVMSAGLIVKAVAGPAGGKCSSQLCCPNCDKLARCRLPRARAARLRNVR